MHFTFKVHSKFEKSICVARHTTNKRLWFAASDSQEYEFYWRGVYWKPVKNSIVTNVCIVIFIGQVGVRSDRLVVLMPGVYSLNPLPSVLWSFIWEAVFAKANNNSLYFAFLRVRTAGITDVHGPNNNRLFRRSVTGKTLSHCQAQSSRFIPTVTTAALDGLEKTLSLLLFPHISRHRKQLRF